MRKPKAAGGWPAIAYTLRKARASGGILRMYRALRAGNACKTCALGMGGQRGGMVNERGHFPEVCKKSVQAMAADMQGRIRPGFFDEFGFDKLSRFTPRELEHSGRLVEPLFAAPGEPTYRPISWDEALAKVSGALKATTPDRTFFYFSGRSSNEAGFLLQLFARLYGTNNVNNCSFFCHQASGVGLASVTGSGTATVTLDDLEAGGEQWGCDLVFVIGGNPASNHPRLMTTLLKLKRRGGKVIVINPLKELGLVRFKVPSDVRSMLTPGGTQIADLYVQPHIGGDIALLSGVAKWLLETGFLGDPARVMDYLAEDFINDHTEGFEALRASIAAMSWDDIVARSGVPREVIEQIGNEYSQSYGTIFAWTMGITHHEHGVNNVRAIANLAMLRGNLGDHSCGLLPLRGHSNVQGMGSVGAVPELKGPIIKSIEDRLGLQLPKAPGLDTLACVKRANEGRTDVALHLGGNLFGSCPDSAFARNALSKIGLTVFLSTTLNTGHVHGRGQSSLILPVLARDEDPQATTQESMFNYVRLSNGGRARHAAESGGGEPRPEVGVIAAIARQVLGDAHPANFQEMEQHATIRQFIGAVIPGYAPIADMDKTKQEFHVEGRIFRDQKFATPTGRARFHPVPLPPLNATGEGELRLMTVRSEGQFNTVVYEEEDLYRGTDRRDVVLMHRDDLRRFNLKENDKVTLTSTTGQLTLLAREADIRPGNAAIYYPEANALVPSVFDNESKTPSFKNIAVRVSRPSSLPLLR
jgi:molybdopterin-dependent oxidoreductase alpha subunit